MGRKNTGSDLDRRRHQRVQRNKVDIIQIVAVKWRRRQVLCCLLWQNDDGWCQAQFLGSTGKLAIIERCDGLASPVAGVVQCVGEVDARLAIEERLLDHIPIFNSDVRLLQQMSHDGCNLGWIEAVVPAHHPFKLEDH